MIEMVVPPTAVARCASGDPPVPSPAEAERAALGSVCASRRRDFRVVRGCAREALRVLGYPAVPILSGPDREPIWPAGVVGSLTHCAGYWAAAVGRDTELRGLGIDAEPAVPLPAGVRAKVVSPDEAAHLATLDSVVFSAKESVFKAWFPLTGAWLGFADVSLSLCGDDTAGEFRADLIIEPPLVDGVPLAAFAGRYAVARGLVVTAAWPLPA